MKGLLLKDWYVLRMTLWLYILCMLGLQGLPGGGFFLVVLYSALMPMSAFAYDDHSHWWDLSAMLPCGVGDLVLSRYILGWAGSLLMAVCYAAAQGAVSLFRDHVFVPAMFAGIGGLNGFFVLLGWCALFQAATMPVSFRFDAEKSRLIRLLFIGVVCGALGAVMGGLGVLQGGTQQTSAEYLGELSALWVWAAAVPVTAVSIPLSMWAYRARRKA